MPVCAAMSFLRSPTVSSGEHFTRTARARTRPGPLKSGIVGVIEDKVGSRYADKGREIRRGRLEARGLAIGGRSYGQ